MPKTGGLGCPVVLTTSPGRCPTRPKNQNPQGGCVSEHMPTSLTRTPNVVQPHISVHGRRAQGAQGPA